MRAYVLKVILPRAGIYITARGTPARRPGLDTIPRVPPMPDRYEIFEGLVKSQHYGKVRDLNPHYKRWLLAKYFNPWAAAWLDLSVYMWHVQTFTEAGGGGGSLPWIRSILTSDNRSQEDEVHELAHMWESARVNEDLWTPEDFTISFRWRVNQFPGDDDKTWANAFLIDPLAGPDPEAYNETYASTASRVMGDMARLPLGLQPYYEGLFRS